MIEIEKVLENCEKNLKRGRAVATGIGVFAAVVKKGEVLLRIREEKESLYGKDLSGNWELIGGGVEIADFETDYTKVLFNALKRELAEEGRLELLNLPSPTPMLPAWLMKNNLIDLAFVVVIPWRNVKRTSEFEERLSKYRVGFFNEEEIEKLNFVSPRMKFLLQQAISYKKL